MTPIFLAGHPPSANQLQRMHFIDRGRARQAWAEAAWASALEAGWKGAAITPARLHCEFIYPNHRRRDIDNLTAGLKGLIDGLVIAGALPDDSLDHLRGIEVTQTIDPKATPGIRVWIERIEQKAA